MERRRYVTQLIGVTPEGEKTRRKKYKEAVKKFQEEQKRGAQIRRRDKKKKEQREKKLSKATGGLVSKKYPVPFVKDNPTERKIDNTNQSFAVVSGLFEEEKEDREKLGRGGNVKSLTKEEYNKLFNVVKSEEAPKKERQSAFKELTKGMGASVTGITKGISSLLDRKQGLTEEQINFLRTLNK